MKPNGYWKEWENVKSELERAIEENAGEFPTFNNLKQMRFGGVIHGLRYHG